MLGYRQFKKVWLTLIDVRAELRNRREKFNRFLPNSMLMKKLELLVNLEEKQEARTLLEAENALDDERIAKERRDLVHEAQLLAQMLLADALDAAGQVYVFGKGAFDRLDGQPFEPDFVDFMDYDLIRQLWMQRVRPDRTSSVVVDALSVLQQSMEIQTIDLGKRSGSRFPSLPKVKLATSVEAFSGRQISLATAFLWGKRINSVAYGTAVTYALTDAGEAFCWGGNKRQWQYFYDDKTNADSEGDTMALTSSDSHSITHGQNLTTPGTIGDLKRVQKRPLTARSEMLKLSNPSQQSENQRRHDELAVRRKYKKTFIKPEHQLPVEEEKRDRLQLVGRYYDFLPPAGDPLDANPNPTYQDLLETVEPELNVDDMALSLQMRGVYLQKQTRFELMEILGECIALELECVGQKFHDHMKDQDKVARRLRHDHHEKQMINTAARTAVMWNTLRILRENIVSGERAEFEKSQKEYMTMKQKIVAEKQRIKRQAREGFIDPKTKDDSSASLLDLNGLTTRGPPMNFMRGDQALSNIAVGSRHALGIMQSGKLICWGVGSFGRLGGTRVPGSNEDDPNSWHQDSHSAQNVPSLKHLRFRQVTCGYGHSLALSTDGKVYIWGSATHGKLGLGKINAKESFSLAPVLMPSLRGINVHKIACGPSHSALLTTNGLLYVWGSGDGGKLGLGDERIIGQDMIPRGGGKLCVIDTPTLVMEPFQGQELVEVSCGTAHTVVLTAVVRTYDNLISGGEVYAAGSNHALGKFTPTFTRVNVQTPSKQNARPIAKVGCGNAHTAIVSCDGEMYTWGSNKGGCTGHPISIPIISSPTLVTCTHQEPANLCLDDNVKVIQSSQSASCVPEFALGVGGPPEAPAALLASSRQFSQTLQEACPFWQVELHERSRIFNVRVVFPQQAIRPGSAAFSSRTLSTTSRLRQRYAILISEYPFNLEERGKYSLSLAKSFSTVHTTFAPEDGEALEFLWHVSSGGTFGRFVRIQAESNGNTTMLSLARVEVRGSSVSAYVGPRVSDVVCGEGATIAICRPVGSKEILRERFESAVRADYSNLWALRQLETYHPFVQDVEAQPNSSLDPISPFAGETGPERKSAKTRCILCRPRVPCVICGIEDALARAASAKKETPQTASDQAKHNGVNTGKPEQGQIAGLSRSNSKLVSSPQPITPTTSKTKKRRPSDKVNKPTTAAPAQDIPLRSTLDEMCAKLLALNTRTDEEEEEAKRRLDLELGDMDALTRAKQEEGGDNGEDKPALSDSKNSGARFEGKVFRKLAFSGLFAKKAPAPPM